MKASRYNVWVRQGDSDYVYNGMSGALLKVGDGEREAFGRFGADDRNSGCSAALLAELAKGRMLVSDDYDELAILSTRYELSRYDTSRLGLTIVTSLGCNFDCPYCFEDKHPSILGEEVEGGLVQLLDDQIPKLTNVHVTWYGGEPLVGKRPLVRLSKAFIERCDAAGVAYTATIITNGYLLDAATCQDLVDCRVSSAQITLDGPPEVHDRMRPLAGGGPTFGRILENVRVAVDYLPVGIRMNVDTENYGRAEELLRVLADAGLSGRLMVYLGQLVGIDDGVPVASSTYTPRCFTRKEFAAAEVAFTELAMRYGFAIPNVPTPVATPCTAVRANELIVGSDGELYKCWESVGNPGHVIGNIRDYKNTNGRLRRWLSYDPFSNNECRTCHALPVCMGGCAHHGMDVLQYDNRCDTFRDNYDERVRLVVKSAAADGVPVATAAIAAPRMDTR